jgi:hypothetical protein
MRRSCLSLLCAAGAAAPACAQVRLEITEDGRASPVVASAIENIGWSTRDDVVPFGATPGWTLALRRQVGAVRIADLNGDLINDLAVGCYISNSFPPYEDWHDMIFYGTGQGGPGALPASASWITADQVHTGDLQIGDINGDERPDLVAISGGTAFSPPRIYFAAPGGPATSPDWIASPPRAGWATGGLVFDVDRDGDLDLLTTNQGVSPDPYRPMHLFLNSQGTLSTTGAWQSAESSIQNTAGAVDLNGDLFPEVAVSKWVNFETGVYPNAAGVLGTAPSWTVGSTGADRGVAIADVNGDTAPDVAFGGPSGTRLYTNSGGVLTLAYTSDPPFDSVQEILLEDVDLDGDKDLLEVHFGDGRTHLYLNSGGSLSVTPSWTFDAAEVGNAIALGDLNGDGRPDLAVGYSGNVSLRVFFGQPPATACYANCDNSTTAPILNVGDFTCFLQRFASGEAYANCDNSTTAPVLNVGDFTCFLQRFAAGCP